MSHLTVVIFFLFSALLSVVLTSFCRFHFQLVLANSTTIENLEVMEGKEVPKFTLGERGNWMQVFGQNSWLWPLPIIGKSGRPLGDGVTWVTRLPTPRHTDPSSESARQSAEPPRPSTPMRQTLTDIREQATDVQPEGTETQNHTSVVVVNMKERGRPSDVDTDSSFLTSAALMRGASAQADDSCLRELSARVETPQPSPLISPDGVLEISLRDPQFFYREMSQ